MLLISNGETMKSLVIADDHVVLRQALCEMLESKGEYHVVGQASDGEELLKLLQGQQPDLVILDIDMPKLDGLVALERMKDNPVHAPVLVLSADESARQVRSAIKAGAKGYIPKNVGLDELRFAINSILNGKTYLSPSVTDALMSTDGPSLTTPDVLSVLSKREVEILTHLADGKPNRVIGKLLHISTRTVDTHRSNILKKLKVKTNAELVKIAIGSGLITV
jgi:DNA-binding NarL/FixJ family response regulator